MPPKSPHVRVRSPRAVHGFTLIELLVVITIIVVLLALLTPALDKAIYEAEMAVCGARLRAVATGQIAYAAGNKRHYPARNWRVTPQARPYVMYDPGTMREGPATDERQYFDGYISLDAFVDPFVDPIDVGQEANWEESYIFVPTSIWGGWRYEDQRGMLRLGDRFTSQDYTIPGRTNTFDVLATDLDQVANNLSEFHSSHPDDAGGLDLRTYQNESFMAEVGGVIVVNPTVLSEWIGNSFRGTADYNYARSDASVFRLDDVEPSHGQNLPGDDRLKAVSKAHWNTADHYPMIPPR